MRTQRSALISSHTPQTSQFGCNGLMYSSRHGEGDTKSWSDIVRLACERVMCSPMPLDSPKLSLVPKRGLAGLDCPSEQPASVQGHQTPTQHNAFQAGRHDKKVAPSSVTGTSSTKEAEHETWIKQVEQAVTNMQPQKDTCAGLPFADMSMLFDARESDSRLVFPGAER